MGLNDQTPLLVGIWAALVAIRFVDSFTITNTLKSGSQTTHIPMNLSAMFGQSNDRVDNVPDLYGDNISEVLSRRKMVTKTAALASVSFLPAAVSFPKNLLQQ